MARASRLRQVGMFVVLGCGVFAGLGMAALAWLAPAFSRSGTSVAATALGWAAGWSLMLGGALAASGQDRGWRGPLLVATGFAWFAGEAANPAASPAVLFTIGLVAQHAWPAVLVHAVLAGMPARRFEGGRPALIALAYVTNLGVLGVLPTLTFDPGALRCALCPANLLDVTSNPVLVATATRLGFLVEAGWIIWAMGLIGWRLARGSGIDRTREAGILIPAAAALAAAGVDGLYSISRGALSNDRIDLILWSIEGVALVLVAAGVAARWLRSRQTRQRVARVALELAATPTAGDLAGELGRVLGDPTLEVLYPLDDGRLVDAHGAAHAGTVAADRGTTAVHRAGRPVAILAHRLDLGDDPSRVADAVDAARLALENERLHAQSSARLLELKTSRTQIVAAGEAERRRLERDLHDGSQQRLLALAIDLAIARRHAEDAPATAGDAASLESEVRAALVELRELAHGIIPRALAEDGLAAALEELAERSTVPLELVALPDERVDAAVEAAAYVVVARTTRDAAVRRASIDARVADGRLIIDLGLDVTGSLAEALLVELEDRCGALEGTVASVVSPDGRTRVRTEIPCVS